MSTASKRQTTTEPPGAGQLSSPGEIARIHTGPKRGVTGRETIARCFPASVGWRGSPKGASDASPGQRPGNPSQPNGASPERAQPSWFPPALCRPYKAGACLPIAVPRALPWADLCPPFQGSVSRNWGCRTHPPNADPVFAQPGEGVAAISRISRPSNGRDADGSRGSADDPCGASACRCSRTTAAG